MTDLPTESEGPPKEGPTKSLLARLAHIDFRAFFLGEVKRTELAERFGIGLAVATRDIAAYRLRAPSNLFLDNVAKVYRPTPEFKPIFEHSPQSVMTALSEGFGEGLVDDLKPLIRCEYPKMLSMPKMSILAPITRAIHRGKAVSLTYTSVESGQTQRIIVPMAMVNIGNRWHVHAYDRRRKGFRDFVFTRMEAPVLLEDSPVADEETVDNDVRWSRQIELELVPHPGHPRPEIVKMDYDMSDGVLIVRVRAANAGYMLRQWNVDCSPDHSLHGMQYALWLRDPLQLYGADAKVAPGYVDPNPRSSQIKAL